MADSHDEPRTGATATRRGVLEAAATGTATGPLATLFSTGAAARVVDPAPAGRGRPLFDVERTSRAVYPQSVASGGPTPHGAIVWTRVAETAYESGQPIGLQVTPAPDRTTENGDANFSVPETRHLRVPADELSPAHDYAVSVDLDGELEPDRFYFYRFVHDGSVFTAGETNHVRLAFEANHPVRVRDRIPESWDVVAGATGTGDAPGEYQWVYLDRGVAETGEQRYLVEAPDGPDATGQYTLGPFQALSPEFGEWMDVPDTSSDETVVGVDT